MFAIYSEHVGGNSKSYSGKTIVAYMTVIAFRKIAQSSSMFQLIDHYPFGLKIQIYNIIFLYSILINTN